MHRLPGHTPIQVQSLAKSASPSSLKKILSTDHFWPLSALTSYLCVILGTLCSLLYHTALAASPKVELINLSARKLTARIHTVLLS